MGSYPHTSFFLQQLLDYGNTQHCNQYSSWEWVCQFSFDRSSAYGPSNLHSLSLCLVLLYGHTVDMLSNDSTVTQGCCCLKILFCVWDQYSQFGCREESTNCWGRTGRHLQSRTILMLKDFSYQPCCQYLGCSSS